ncbi:MAG TPA: RdgB/HAM1 family non-canonical purine NTP pyrophosphatase [Candidatus Hydrogenedens sp.]|nr:RdgB/HAM1 family non-canonical purine NTP pyrophosphatase [Candidatus Hydrogenedens sp.]HOL20766.1 RdgB/HAM1 family non-canonical purine NTP pyrophosphatase [Candidatus Hydrogenedens sp.]HPP57861.1 RdgB/HAM1 family non-canonical purine NTP pyrophosphatase [Candidatus Hydrogenedens sp.]
MKDKKILVIATGNKHKFQEITKIMDLKDWEVKFLKDFPEFEIPEETGKTYEENAFIKAKTCADKLKLPALADDSGLEVDALGGEPGVYSSRYGGIEGDSKRNITRLLEEMNTIPEGKRTAKFICCSMLVFPDGFSHIEWGEVKGRITFKPSGTAGFGYDPIFIPDGYKNTFAELSPEEKNKISHRAIAFRKMADFLTHFSYEYCSS